MPEGGGVCVLNDLEVGVTYITYRRDHGPSKVKSHIALLLPCIVKPFYPLETQVFLIPLILESFVFGLG